VHEPLSELSGWRPFYGRFHPFANRKDDFHRILGRKKIKYYGSHIPKGSWLYMPESLKIYGNLKSNKRLASFVNKQSLDELRDQADRAIEQIIFRCLTDDAYAQIYGRYYVAYIVTGDDVLVCSIKLRPTSQ
jgi:hypothetical protein